MLVLQPSLLSLKPIGQLINEAKKEAELEAVAKFCLWAGCGLVAGGLIAAAVGGGRREQR